MSPPQAETPVVELLVLDDHAIVRQGVMMLVQQLPWPARCRGAASLEEALQLLEHVPADIAVVDLSLKGGSGLDAIDALRSRWPALPVVVLSMHADPIPVQRALHRGAIAFVAKDDAADELAAALQHARAGTRYLSQSVRSLRLGDPAATGGAMPRSFEVALSQLTPRELEVLTLIGRGRSATEIAETLGRSIKTVEAHRNNLREKLGFSNNRQLLQFSARWSQLDGGG